MRYLADDEFLRGKVPMTKREVRILTMAELAAMPGDIVADIGAGTGSLSIEAARAVGDGTVYAVERNPEAVQLIRENARRFGLTNIVVEEQEAPAGLEQLPLLDGAIVGGSGGTFDDCFHLACDFPICSFEHCNREANKVAHKLAKLARFSFI